MIAPAHNRRRYNGSPKSTAEAFDGLRNDYDAAKSSRYRRRRSGVASSGSGADYHYRSEADYLRMLEQARDMDRNDVVVGQMVNRAITNIVQEGFTLDVKTGDKKLDLDLFQRFWNWADDPEQCDVAGELCFYDMEQLVPRATLVDGDVFVLPLQEGSLQLVESHRCRTPANTRQNVVHGVLLSEKRRRLQYWFTKDDVDPNHALRLVSEIRQYLARDEFNRRQVLHVYDPRRISQTRGVTAFAPVFNALGMFEDINFAKMVQQQVVSCFAIFRMRTADQNNLPSVDPVYGEQTTEALTSGGSRTIEGVAPGMEITGEPGETLEGFSPNVPNAEFFDHVKLILNLVSVNLGLPLAVVLLDPSDTNFSGWRGAIDQARMGFRRNQKWLVSRFHAPVYEWKIRQFIDDDKALKRAANRRGISIFTHRWNAPRWPYIEPKTDAEADGVRLEKLLTSPTRLHAERGGDYQDSITESIRDNFYAVKRAIRAAKKLKELEGVDVEWRDMLYLQTTPKIAAPKAPAAKPAQEAAV